MAAWLTLDGTHVDHPVVKGTDNFEYLDRDFYGKTYAGGTLFLDEQCPKDFAQEYQLIHGHHMAGGAMFGDLKKYLDKNFFHKNKRGQLLTPKGRYDLEIIAAGIFDAYDSKIYSINGKKNRPMESFRRCRRKRPVRGKFRDRLLCLSTCSGDMDDRRIVVFCRMTGPEESHTEGRKE